jgi:adenosylcobinamide-phosphate synthase
MWEFLETSVTLAFLALLIEALLGYPDRLFHTIGHPVSWIGRLIAWCDRTFNRETMGEARRFAGAVALLGVIAVTAAISLAVEHLALRLPFGIIAASLVASTLLAQRSLYTHVARVAAALETDGLAAARMAVSHIVGRDPETLDAAGVCRAAIESLAENFSDGVVAPVFWLAVAGLPGGAVYKAINTADSMVGHRTTRHKAFGWAAARLDDLVNLPASRLAALLIIAATQTRRTGAAWRAVRHDAPRHRSPNAGYPEAAMAGALGLALAGPRVYGGIEVPDALMGSGRREANAADIHAALALYRRADALLIAFMGVLALACWAWP